MSVRVQNSRKKSIFFFFFVTEHAKTEDKKGGGKPSFFEKNMRRLPDYAKKEEMVAFFVSLFCYSVFCTLFAKFFSERRAAKIKFQTLMCSSTFIARKNDIVLQMNIRSFAVSSCNHGAVSKC